MRRAEALAALLLLLLAACAGEAGGPSRAVTMGPAIRLKSADVPLNATELPPTRGGRFDYAGGIALTSPDTSRLHGLSDLKVWPDRRLLAVSDEGDLFEGRLQLDGAGRLRGVREGRLAPLIGPDGSPLPAEGKNEADAEGVAEFANGDRLVSLERDDRILLYPAAGGPPRKVVSPPEVYPFNLGMEALAQAPELGPDAYIVGGEDSGQTWICHLAAGCTRSFLVDKPKEAGLSAVAVLPGGGRAYLLRSFSVIAGLRVTLRIVDAAGATVDELRLAPPLAIDNFEGLAALPQPGGAIRFYLLSDDNFSKLQRTLLLAFDWRPAAR